MKIEGITKQEIEECLAHFEKMANTYFWTPPASASSRRYEECKNSRGWFFKVDGVDVAAEVEVSCSCKNYYSTRTVRVGAEFKPQMVRYLKKLISEGEFISTTTEKASV